MARPSKKRAEAEKKGAGSSDTQQSVGESGGRDGTQRSSPKSIPRLDGNRDPGVPGKGVLEYTRPNDLKNLSEFLGMGGWAKARGFKIPDSLPQRPTKFNSFGKECSIVLNTYNVLQAPNAVVYQYDVSWGPGTDPTKRVLVKKIWNSKAVKAAIGEPQSLWIYDGNKLAWSAKKVERDDLRITVDLDEEDGRSKNNGKNIHKVFIKLTRQVDFSGLHAWLSQKAVFSTECIDTINFLDHVLREEPSRKYTQIKKSFYQRGEQRFDLGGGIEAFKGVFASLRPVLNDKFDRSIAINVDVANGTFWRAQELTKAIGQMFNCSLPQFQQRFKEAKKDWRSSNMKKDLARLKRVGVTAFHIRDNLSQWTIDEIYKEDCHGAKFPDPDDRSNVPPNQKRQITIYNYFKQKYNLQLTPGIPVVKMTKKIRGGPVFLPMDYLKIDPNQRYNTKLSDTQTSNMIKFAVTLPAQRRAAIENGVRLLDWANDPYLRHYQIKVNPTPSKVKARILPPPLVAFAGPAPNKPNLLPEKDLVAGRWRLDGKKFQVPNTNPIAAWGICVIGGRGSPTVPHVQTFADSLVKIYEGHGGRFSPKFNKKPFMSGGNLADGGNMVTKFFNQCGNHFNARPMFIVFVVNDRNSDVYRRLKRSCDCQFGIPSQVLQSKHVIQNSAQYISNVCMKINAKLGGCTTIVQSQVIPKVAPKSAWKDTKTMVIGADVSHPAPGAGSDERASFAAITMSSDATFTRYWAQCQTNGNRVEMVTTQNIYDHMGEMAKLWMNRLNQNKPPDRVLYIRDGVSEGQYAAVLEEEVRDMRETFKRIGAKSIPKFTVIIAGKRHHIRFFPERGDRNGNPLPGTLVETGCTHPFEFDFYLCSHVAIKGTARPIHYQVILNEGEWHAAEIQSFLFEHSYQYVRSTTPVSLHPAVYYAHLAADRSRAHVNESPVSSGKKEAKAEQRSSTGSSTNRSVEIQPLTEMSKAYGLKETMWFI